jgi:Tfp pilus assembly protein PilF
MDSRAGKLWQRGMVHFQHGNMEAAQANFEAFLAREPSSGPGRFRLSLVLARRGRYQAALALVEQVVATEPEQAEALAHHARCLLGCGQLEAARAVVLHALSLPRAGAVVLDALAVILTRLEDPTLAMGLFDQATAIDPAQPSLYFNRALARRQFGLAEGAEQDLRTCLALHPTHAKAHWALAGLRGRDDPGHRSQLAARLENTLSPSDRELTALALFRELDALGDPAVAWPALQAGIASRAGRSVEPAEAWADALVAACGDAFAHPPVSQASTATPIFIFGMPQSGVALLGSLLSRHPRIQHLGRLQAFAPLLSRALGRDSTAPLDAADFLRLRDIDAVALGREFLAATGATGGKSSLLVCESRPMDFQLAGIIARALPGARLLHMRRDPLDTCVSILGHAGGETALSADDPVALARCYLQYHRLMQHWHAVLPGRLMDVDYESLVSKPDMVLRVACSFLGIRYGSTLRMGLSLHSRSIGRGRRYAEFLPGLDAGLRPLYRETRSA